MTQKPFTISSEALKAPPWVEQPTAAEKALAEMTAERNRLLERIKQDNKDYGCELRDPNGTIWEHAKKVQEERDKWRGIAEEFHHAMQLWFGEELHHIPLEFDEAAEAYRQASK